MSRKVLMSLAALAFVPAPVAAQAESNARTTTVKSSKSNTSDRVNLNSSKSNAFRATTVKSSKSNTSDRMGGGGGKGGVQLNPQPEPPGRAKY